MIQINHLYAAIPFELVANNEPAAATGDPAAILYRNGSASGVTVTVVATAVVGLYHCSFTTGSDWEKTDRLYLQASATVGGISDRKIIWDSFSEPDAVMRGTDDAATEAKQDTAKTAIDAILVDTDATIPGLIATAGSDATLAKQDEILAAVQGAQVVQVESPNVRGNLVLTQGDTYDGIANPKAQWNTTVDYTDGWAVALTIRDKGDAVVYTTTGTVDSATVVSVAITTPTVAPMAGCPGSWQGKFDVQLSKAGSIKTIALGVVYINEDQTR